MSKEKTPIEELIEILENSKAELTMYEMAHNDGISEAMCIVASFIPKEREAIEEAYGEGKSDGMYGTILEMEKDGSEYYNDKYGK